MVGSRASSSQIRGVCVGLLATTLAVPSARAQPATEVSPTDARVADPTLAPEDGAAADAVWRKVYEEGKVHYRLREYRQAVSKFSEAYRLSQKPQLLFNIAQAYRLAGDCASAARFYRTFLDANPEAEVAPVEARIAEMDACEAERVRAEAARDDWKIRVWALSGAGLGLVLAGIGGAVMVSARSDAAAVRDACTPADPCVWAEQAARDDSWRSNQRLGGGLLIAGSSLMLIGGGILLWRWLASDAAASPTTDVGVQPEPGGGVVVLRRRF